MIDTNRSIMLRFTIMITFIIPNEKSALAYLKRQGYVIDRNKREITYAPVVNSMDDDARIGFLIDRHGYTWACASQP